MKITNIQKKQVINGQAYRRRDVEDTPFIESADHEPHLCNQCGASDFFIRGDSEVSVDYIGNEVTIDTGNRETDWAPRRLICYECETIFPLPDNVNIEWL